MKEKNKKKDNKNIRESQTEKTYIKIIKEKKQKKTCKFREG